VIQELTQIRKKDTVDCDEECLTDECSANGLSLSGCDAGSEYHAS